MYPRNYRLALGIGLAAMLLLPMATLGAEEPVVVKNYGDSLVFEPQISAKDMILTVTGPCNYLLRQSLRQDDALVFKLDSTTIDGTYRFEVTAIPEINGSIIDVLEAARKTGDNSEVDQLCREGELPGAPLTQASGFTIFRGEIVYDEESVEDFSGSKIANAGGGSPFEKTVLTNSNGTIRNSLCVGFDCPDSPTYDDTTILMMENNTRVKFDDTSSISGFPNRDWELEANSRNSGGGNYFSVNDCGSSSQGGCVTDRLFTLEANAPQHSLYVDSGGDIGNRTSTPVVDFHTATGDTPTLRLEQTNASGFQPQTWDIAGNETSFFVRDATNGSTLPFRIRPGASSNVLVIDSDDDVGIGILSPEENVHVAGASNPRILIADTTDNADDKPGVVLRSPAATSGGDWRFETDNAGNFQIDFGPSTGPELLISDTTGATNGTVTINGDLMVNGTCTGCDDAFRPDFPLLSMEEQAMFMYENSYLPAVGPTPEGKGLINVFAKTTGMLQELEKAHIYIDQLHQRLNEKDGHLSDMQERLAALEQLVQQLADGQP